MLKQLDCNNLQHSRSGTEAGPAQSISQAGESDGAQSESTVQGKADTETTLAQSASHAKTSNADRLPGTPHNRTGTEAQTAQPAADVAESTVQPSNAPQSADRASRVVAADSRPCTQPQTGGKPAGNLVRMQSLVASLQASGRLNGHSAIASDPFLI